MDQCVLMVGFDNIKLKKIKQAYLDYNISIHCLPSMSKAVKALTQSVYLIVVIFLYPTDNISHIRTIRTLTNAPIIVLKDRYIGAEKVKATKAGADEYIQWPETIQEFMASCYSFIRRFTVLNGQCDKVENTVSHENTLICEEHHKIFICGIEMRFTNREFELFSLLAAHPERVLTYEQLFEIIWDGGEEVTENSIHSCVRRIRRKLETVSQYSCSIENVRNVGYFFRYNKT